MKSGQETHLKVIHPIHLSPLEQAVNGFMLDGEARNLAASTLAYYRSRLNPFLAYLRGQGITDLAAVNANHIRAYLVHLQQ